MGKLFDYITEHEVSMIGNYINWYADPSSTGTRSVSVKTILEPWDLHKSEYLNKMFGEKLIHSKMIEFKAGEEELVEQIQDIMLSPYNCDINFLFNELYNIRYKIFDTNIEAYYGLNNLLNPTAITRNIYSGKTFSIMDKFGKTIKIQNGMKAIKAIEKVVKAFELNENAMEEFRLLHSQVLNQKKLKGNLCISIHPLDYMTMSDNDCNWNSCMSWRNDGCYRQGTVEMMNSSMVVIAYLRASEDMEMPRGDRWSNKKWRELYIVTPEIITNIKAYPYKNNNLTKEVLDWLRELAQTAGIGDYDTTITQWHQHTPFLAHGDKEFRIETYTNKMYNDFGRENQMGYLGAVIDAYEDTIYELHYSGPCECMYCGKIYADFPEESYMVCDDCVPRHYCECCGSYVDDEDGFFVDDKWYCSECYYDNYCDDVITDETIRVEEAIQILFTSSNGDRIFDVYPAVYVKDLNELKDYGCVSGPIYDNTVCRRKCYVPFNSLTAKGKELICEPYVITEEDFIKNLPSWKHLFTNNDFRNLISKYSCIETNKFEVIKIPEDTRIW